MLESELQVVFGSIVLMWSIPIASWIAIELGIGIGFGGVFGALWRTEAYPDGETWRACDGPLEPNTSYCEASVAQGGEGQYQRREGTPEPYNFTGGVPPLWFWIDLPRVAVRIKPLRQLQIRVEGGSPPMPFTSAARSRSASEVRDEFSSLSRRAGDRLRASFARL